MSMPLTALATLFSLSIFPFAPAGRASLLSQRLKLLKRLLALSR